MPMKLSEGAGGPQTEKPNDHQSDNDQADEEIALFEIGLFIHEIHLKGLNRSTDQMEL